MAFSFECPHCEMGFEAEFELCGSTCTCVGCGGLFVVPEVDPDSLNLEHAARKAGTGGRNAGEGDPGLVAEAEKLRAELAEAAQKRRELERELDRQKAAVSREKALSNELRSAKEAQKKSEARLAEFEKQLKELQGRFEGAEKSEKEARGRMLELEAAGEQVRRDLAAAREEAQRFRGDAEQPAKDLARLREEIEAAEAKNRALADEVSLERKKAAEQSERLRRELTEAGQGRKTAEQEQAARTLELERLAKALDAERALSASSREKLESARKEAESARLELEERSRLARTAVEEANRRHGDEVAVLQKTLLEGRARLGELERERDKASRVASESGKELERLRSELAGVKAEKWSAERGFAEEHQRLLENLQRAEAERDTLREEARLLARAAAEPDGEQDRLRAELSASLSAVGVAERALVAERKLGAERQRLLEQDRDAAEKRHKALLEEIEGLRTQVQQAQATAALQSAKDGSPGGLSAEAEAELRQTLAGRDQEIQRLAAQLRSLPQNLEREVATGPLPGWISLRAAALLSGFVLAVGILGGAVFSRQRSAQPMRVDEVAKKEQSPVKESPGAAQGGVAAQSAPSLPTVGGDPATVPPSAPETAAAQAPNPITATGGSLASNRAGMPAHLPDQFLGIRFGTELAQVSGIAQWKETAGKRHRKAELLGSEVEAVLTADTQNRLIMGSYVRVASRQADSLTPFLEWAVNVQDAVSALYGEPIRVHSVDGAVDAVEVVRKIAAGEDYYQATWERENEEGMIDLSIRVFNERSVVFRMEYRSRQYYAAFIEGQTARDGAKDSAKDSAKDPAKDPAKGPAKDSAGEAVPSASSPAKVE
jgi:hypothetical protein